MPACRTSCSHLPDLHHLGRAPWGWPGSLFLNACGVPQRCLSMDAQLALRHLQLKRRVRSHCRGGRVRERRDREAALGGLTPPCTTLAPMGDGSSPDAGPAAPPGFRP